MKIAFSLMMLMAATAGILPVASAATRVANYEKAQRHLTDDGYLLFIYGRDWDKRGEEVISELYNDPDIEKAAGKAVMIKVPMPDSMQEKEAAKLSDIIGKLPLPHAHSNHAFPAIAMYDKSGKLMTVICGQPMVYPTPSSIARIISVRRNGMARQQELLSAAEKCSGEEKAKLLLQACRVPNIEDPENIRQRIKEADPEDKAGCLAALNYYNNPLGEKIKNMQLLDILAELDIALSNPLLTVQQKQNTCAFAIGTIRRKVGMGGSTLIHRYAKIMKELNPYSALGQSADIVIRDWTQGLQYVRGWAPDTLPMQDTPTELQGKLPIREAGQYEVRFEPTGGKHHATITRVALYDGDTLISEDTRRFTLSSPASYFVTAPADMTAPRIFITCANDDNTRDTRGKFIIRKK